MKDKKNIIKAIIILGFSAIIPVCLEKFYYRNEPFSMDRFVIIFLILLFIGCHFLFNIKKMWNFIYKKRYVIGVVLFSFIVINGYNGSSMTIYNGAIQGEYQVENGNSILGNPRVIRGDEWAVGPLTLSQALPINDFGTINHSVMASEDLDVTFYFKMPCRDISILSSPSQIGFLFLPLENAFSFSWYFNIFLLFFATFEFIMILTKKNKLISLFGSVVILFAPATQWWGAFNIVAYGEFAVVCFYYFLKTDIRWKKILYSILIGYFGACYIMSMYPAWLIPYGYFFLAIVVWMIYAVGRNNRLKDYLLLILVSILVMTVLILPPYLNGRDIVSLIMNTSYPGQRISTGGYGWDTMFKFATNFLTPFTESNNASEMSQFICFYPIPILMGLYYSIKNRGKDFLLNALLVVVIFLSVWNFIQLPEIIAKITMLSMSTVERSNITVGFINIIIMIICINHYQNEEKLLSVKSFVILLISILYAILCIYESIQLYPEFMTMKKNIIIFVLLVYLVSLLLLNNKKTNKIFIYSFMFISLCTGGTVHPINKGLKAVYDKPISKEIQKITTYDPYSKWITVESPYYLPNYAVANGARMINSTNYFPNFDFWKLIDPNETFKDIYNRYAHVKIDITDEETTIDLNYTDQVQLNLNINDLSKIDAKYILSSVDLTTYVTYDINLKQIYNEYGMFIYEVIKK